MQNDSGKRVEETESQIFVQEGKGRKEVGLGK